jgi:hypothetical protein
MQDRTFKITNLHKLISGMSMGVQAFRVRICPHLRRL